MRRSMTCKAKVVDESQEVTQAAAKVKRKTKSRPRVPLSKKQCPSGLQMKKVIE